MKNLTEIMITNVSDSEGYSFGVTMESGEAVFIPSRLGLAWGDMEPGDTFQAILAPNYADKQHITPWQVVKLEDGQGQ
jgi:hypothetical protein|tara:strand:- start:1020 stop:1253 length:234 start_codon:yes stop_codon:yes gene_type:complete